MEVERDLEFFYLLNGECGWRAISLPERVDTVKIPKHQPTDTEKYIVYNYIDTLQFGSLTVHLYKQKDKGVLMSDINALKTFLKMNGNMDYSTIKRYINKLKRTLKNFQKETVHHEM